jgi:glycosyltransferase involved in cell wall biosynthesis
MLVANSVRGDPRVWRESKTLADGGHLVSAGGIERESQFPPFDVVSRLEITLVPPSRLSGLAARTLKMARKAEPRPMPTWSRQNRAWKALRTGNSLFQFMGDVTSLLKHTQSVKRLAPDVIHAHDLNALWPAVVLGRRYGIRVVYDSHEVFSEMMSFQLGYKRWLQRLEQRLLNRVEACITVSDGIADLFVERYKVKRPYVIRNIPDGVPIAPRSHAGPITFIYQGGLIPGRGLESLVRAFSILPQGCTSRLVIRGFGPMLPGLREEISRLGLWERVVLAGPVPPSEVILKASEADVGVIPFLPINTNNRLALPNKLFEYLLAGIAILADGGLQEIGKIIERNQCGRVYASAETTALSEQLSRLSRDGDVMRLRQNAYQAAGRELNWDAEKHKLEAVYEVLQGS